MNVDLENSTARVGGISSLSALAALMFSDSSSHLASPRVLEASFRTDCGANFFGGRAVKRGRILGTGFCEKGSFDMPDISEAIAELTDRLIAFRAVRTIVSRGSDISVGQRKEASCPAVRYSSAGIDLRRSTAWCRPRGEQAELILRQCGFSSKKISAGAYVRGGSHRSGGKVQLFDLLQWTERSEP
ncbi:MULTISPECIES: hypothetical protein [unclassified Bradyrhizobium]|uniref:hypothetical protein n=1 Tax=unclassified Bradyrhizobium TaxID=2631580 RepID=UPI001FF70E3B|nr:hypothetical protein [Bradyrhizobium sp. 2]MCK1462997.1 hypothetical protein [Bradyrhizobium sp. 2]